MHIHKRITWNDNGIRYRLSLWSDSGEVSRYFKYFLAHGVSQKWEVWGSASRVRRALYIAYTLQAFGFNYTVLKCVHMCVCVCDISNYSFDFIIHTILRHNRVRLLAMLAACCLLSCSCVNILGYLCAIPSVTSKHGANRRKTPRYPIIHLFCVPVHSKYHHTCINTHKIWIVHTEACCRLHEHSVTKCVRIQEQYSRNSVLIYSLKYYLKLCYYF